MNDSEETPVGVPFGNYWLLQPLAVGGMAELFLARPKDRGELLVVKRILPHLAQEAEFVQMFLDEARIAAQLHHPNVIRVFELGKWGRAIFLAMEYVEGLDARKILQQQAKQNAPIPYALAAYLAAEVCAGLGFAHNATGMNGSPLGVVHRDVSPQNVMVSLDGDVKLVDFGIAKATAMVERSRPGMIKGKFLYLAPEQVSREEKIDWRADLFATGSMLYELSTGQGAFQRGSSEAVLYAIREEAPLPPEQVRPDYPPELSRIVLKCLVKDRNARYQSAAELREDLLAFVGGQADRARLGAYTLGFWRSAARRTPSGFNRVKPSGLTEPPRRRPSADHYPSVGDHAEQTSTATDPSGGPPSKEPGAPSPSPRRAPSRAPWAITLASAALAAGLGWWALSGDQRVVSVVFRAPIGTAILHEGRRIVPGERHPVAEGPLDFQYQCPGMPALRRKRVQVQAASQQPFEVPLGCPDTR